MAAKTQDTHDADSGQGLDAGSANPDPRDTDHPTGKDQAAENAADESPS